MVIRHPIHSLRDRPEDERRAFAGFCAIAVMGVFFAGWSMSLFGSMRSAVAEQPSEHITTGATAQVAAIAPSLNSLVETIYTDNAETQTPADTSYTDFMNPSAYPDPSQTQTTAVPEPTSADAATDLQAALQH